MATEEEELALLAAITPGPLGPCQPYCQLADLDCANLKVTDLVAAATIADASTILYALLGRTIHGVCTATVETDTQCWNWLDGRLHPGGWAGNPDYHSIILQAPVVSITSVSVDGVALDPGDYILRDGFELRLVSKHRWSGVVRIVYSFGVPVPDFVRDAAAELATELVNDRCGRASCLPADVKTVNRDGISMGIDREVERVREAGPNLPAVMIAMSVLNPTNQRSQAEIASPDVANRTYVVRTFS